ncbi:MAG: hypothetical protein CL449_02325 [Acidimicrobiaceae bacterium]|nr:hypothetical protein [Acidimicrobiaceae bacterium]
MRFGVDLCDRAPYAEVAHDFFPAPISPSPTAADSLFAAVELGSTLVGSSLERAEPADYDWDSPVQQSGAFLDVARESRKPRTNRGGPSWPSGSATRFVVA